MTITKISANEAPGWHSAPLPAGVAALAESLRSTADPETVWRDWRRERRLPLLDGNAICFLAWRPGAERVWVHLDRQKARLPLEELAPGLFAASVAGLEAEGLEYWVGYVRGEIQETVRHPENPLVSWKKDPPSVIRRADSPFALLEYFPERRLLTILPPGYYSAENTSRRYPVMYWQDGQNLPSGTGSPHGGWKADSTVARMAAEGALPAIIQVGIVSQADRMGEYTGWSSYALVPEYASRTDQVRALSAAYENLVLVDTKPWIDSRYRTLPDRAHTGTGGSSAGAMMALWLACRHPDTFGLAAGFSGGELPYRDLIPGLPALAASANRPKLYVDCGTVEVDQILLPGTEALGAALQQAGWREGQDLFYRVFQGDRHDEAAWARRLPGALAFLFGPTSQEPGRTIP